MVSLLYLRYHLDLNDEDVVAAFGKFSWPICGN